MGNMSISGLLTLLKSSDIELTEVQKKNLIINYNNLTSKKVDRIDDRTHIIRALISRGIPKRTIAQKLNIQNYQVDGSLGKRRTIEDDIDWTIDSLQVSGKYKEMVWSEEEFEEIIGRPAIESAKGIVFDYSKVEQFRNELVG